MSRDAGLSLTELVFTVGLASIILALALPALEQTVRVNRLVAEANKLVRAVHLAKNEAAKHYREVVICPSFDGSACANDKTAWQQGWLVFVNLDKDRPARVGENEPILLAHRVLPHVEVSANRTNFAFHHYARRSTNGTIVFCSAQKKALAKAVIVSYTGRPRVASTRTDGQPYRCEH